MEYYKIQTLYAPVSKRQDYQNKIYILHLNKLVGVMNSTNTVRTFLVFKLQTPGLISV